LFVFNDFVARSSLPFNIDVDINRCIERARCFEALASDTRLFRLNDSIVVYLDSDFNLTRDSLTDQCRLYDRPIRHSINMHGRRIKSDSLSGDDSYVGSTGAQCSETTCTMYRPIVKN